MAFHELCEIMAQWLNQEKPRLDVRCLLTYARPSFLTENYLYKVITIFSLQDPNEAVFLFTRPSNEGRLAAAGMVPPPAPLLKMIWYVRHARLHGRMGRGGRIIFDRLRPGNSHCVPLSSLCLLHLSPVDCSLEREGAKESYFAQWGRRGLEVG